MRVVWIRVAVATLVILGAPHFARADVWTESLAADRAERRSPRVQIARTAVDTAAAMTAYGTVPIVGNPMVGVRALAGVPDREASTLGFYVGLPIEVSGARSAWRREAVEALAEAQAALDAARIDARAEARLAYAEVAIAIERVRATQSRLDTARELLSRTEMRVRAAAATELDRALAQRELGLAEFELASARRARDGALARFRAAVDLAPSASVEIAPIGSPALEPDATRASIIARAIANRPEIRGLRATASRWDRAGDRLRAESIAPLVVALESEVQQYRYASVGASLNWSVPLWQLAQGPRATARAESRGANTRGDVTARDTGRAAAAAWDALQGSLEEYRAMSERALPALERTLDLTERLFESGSVDWFRVLLARQELATARLQTLDALRSAWTARIALDRMTAGR